MVTEEHADGEIQNQPHVDQVILPADEPVEGDAEYVPGEVLVKFREGSRPQDVLGELDLSAEDIQRVHSIKSAVAKYKQDYKLEKDSDGWYWFRGKNYREEESVPDAEIFEEAYNKMTPSRRGIYRNYRITLPDSISVEEAVSILRQNPNIEYAYPNYIREAYTIPNDPLFDQQWALSKISAPDAWDITEGNPDVVIAIIDTGVDYNHEDLASNIWTNPDEVPGNGIDDDGNDYIDDYMGYDFVSVSTSAVAPGEDPGPRDNDPMDVHGHGTHCSGIAAAITNNGLGIAGVAPNCRIMAVRAGYKMAGDGRGRLIDADIEQAILYAIDNGAKVISMSFGANEPGAYKDEIRTAYSEGIVLIAAAGNNSSSDFDYPAGMDEVIAVAATDQNDERSVWSSGLASNYGHWVDVAAPGTSILSALPGDQYASWDGTSMACPHVAGLAALLVSKNPEYSNEQIRWLIRNNVRTLPELEPEFFPGFGIIDAHTSVASSATPPRISAYVKIENIDYDNAEIRIKYTGTGGDFGQLRMGYKKIEDGPAGIWEELIASTTPVQDAEFVWDIEDLTRADGTYLVELIVQSNDARETRAYDRVTIEYINFYYIEPEIITFASEPKERHKLVTGLYRPGSRVPLVGKSVGQYYLEWRKGYGDWNNSDFDYDVIQGYLGIWDTSAISSGGMYHVRIVDESGLERSAAIMLDEKIRPGYPIKYGPDKKGRVTVKSVNMDEDEEPELAIWQRNSELNRFDIYTHDAVLSENWHFDDSTGLSQTPAFFDIDGDGIDEIFLYGSARVGSGICLRVYGFTNNGDIIFERDDWVPGWFAKRDPIIACDMDNDSEAEIIFRSVEKIYLMDSTGMDYSPAWPKDMVLGGPVSDWWGAPAATAMSTGNFDDDSDLELAVIQNWGYVSGEENGNIIVHVFNIDGSYVQGWPVTLPDCYWTYSLRSGDIAGDEHDELVIFANRENAEGVESLIIYALEKSGDVIFEKPFKRGDINILADINGDRKAEIIFNEWVENYDRRMHAIDGGGNEVDGWPCKFFSHTTPALAVDIDGDNTVEIIAKSGEKLYIIGPDGKLKRENPFDGLRVTAYSIVNCFNDIDADGYGELMIVEPYPVWTEARGSWVLDDANVYAYDTEAPFKPELQQWPEMHHDKYNTNRWTDPSGQPNNFLVLESIPNKEVEEDALLTFTLSVQDPDAGDSMTYHALDMPDGATLDAATGEFSWTPTYEQAGSYRVLFRAEDEAGLFSPYRFMTICVKNVNRRPVFDPPAQNRTIEERALLMFTASATDPDGDYITYHAEGLPSGATFNRYGGRFMWRPTYEQAGVYTVTVTAEDGLGLLSEPPLDITITVVDVNAPPVLASVSDKEVDEGSELTFTLSATDVDGDDVTYHAYNMPEAAKLNMISGVFSWIPTYEQAGIHMLVFRAEDEAGLFSSYRYVRTSVRDVNRPPVLASIGNKTVNEGLTLEIVLSATDADGDSLTYLADISQAAGASFNTATKTFTWTPSYDQGSVNGKQYSATFSVADGTDTASETITITVYHALITITSHQNNATVPHTGFTLTGTADDASGVAEVQVRIYDRGKKEGNRWVPMDGKATYDPDTKEWTFKVTRYHMTADRACYLYVRAKDIYDNRSGWKSIRVKPIEPPTITITSPRNRATVSYAKGFTLKAAADDASGVAEVQVRIYDRGRKRGKRWVLKNGRASYDPAIKKWVFNVTSDYMTADRSCYLYVRAWDVYNNRSRWQRIRVKAKPTLRP